YQSAADVARVLGHRLAELQWPAPRLEPGQAVVPHPPPGARIRRGSAVALAAFAVCALLALVAGDQGTWSANRTSSPGPADEPRASPTGPPGDPNSGRRPQDRTDSLPLPARRRNPARRSPADH